jgi:hypothetical protein
MARFSHVRASMTVQSALLCISFVLTACGAGAAPPASSAPPPAAQSDLDGGSPAGSQGAATETEGAELRSELATVGARLQELTKKLDGARDDVKADMTAQIAALQKRDDELKAQLKAIEARVGADAEKARHELHGAIVDLEKRLQGVADRIQH